MAEKIYRTATNGVFVGVATPTIIFGGLLEPSQPAAASGRHFRPPDPKPQWQYHPGEKAFREAQAAMLSMLLPAG